MSSIFYQPSPGVSADYIPYYENGTYYLFYLRDYRDGETYGEGTPWYLITTQDFVHFADHGEVLPRGTVQEQDLYVFTGSVTKISGRYHIYYTGHNPHLRRAGKPEQAVMHAVSDDLLHWKKCPEDTFYAPSEGYEPHDWRDPFVWYNPEEERWWMLLAARKQTGASRYRGITALCSSRDGFSWQVEAPLWDPNLYFTHECPDLFKLGDWYYMIYSEFTRNKVTRYRMSRSPKGPWLAPPDDRFDTCAWYAAKSAGTEKERYLFGWLATRENNSDTGRWQWGGCLVVHRMIQNPDGTLRTVLPETVKNSLPSGQPAALTLGAPDRQACRALGEMGESGVIRCTFRPESGDGCFSVALAADNDLSEGYFLRIEPGRGRMVLDIWPRIAERMYEPGMERPVKPTADGAYSLTILIDGSAACAYINGEASLCFRMYDRTRAFWGVVAENTALQAEADAGWKIPPESAGEKE